MMQYSVRIRDKIFIKGLGFLGFAENMGIKFAKNINKKLSGIT